MRDITLYKVSRCWRGKSSNWCLPEYNTAGLGHISTA